MVIEDRAKQVISLTRRKGLRRQDTIQGRSRDDDYIR